MTRQEQNIVHLKRSIEHCVSVIALCRVSGSKKAEASYEARLAQLNAELAELEGRDEPVYNQLITDLERKEALGEIE